MGRVPCGSCHGRGKVPNVLRFVPSIPDMDMLEHENGLWVRYSDWNNMRLKAAALEESERNAHEGIAACELCVHLGAGDPLVDVQARENEKLYDALRKIGAIVKAAGAISKETEKDLEEETRRHEFPCPKCGSHFVERKTDTQSNAALVNKLPYMWANVPCCIQCDDCGYTGPMKQGEEAAWEIWKKEQ